MMSSSASNSQNEQPFEFSIIEPGMQESDGFWMSVQDVWQVLVGVDRSGDFPVNVPEWRCETEARPFVLGHRARGRLSMCIGRWASVHALRTSSGPSRSAACDFR